MKPTLFLTLLLALLVAACASAGGDENDGASVLLVTDGANEKRYTAEDLQALGAGQASFLDVAYLGIPLAVLLQDAGFDPQTLRAVKVTALDGYSVNYEPDFFLLPDTLVSYARLDGPLAEDELPFRMVLPAGEGKQNVRQLVEIKVIP
ncbi:MAG: hypothetical protein FJZ96_13905 [Chloroflexi bacterium]|nr:hypothetical protein [Chloroflexota bacterium]